MTLVARRSSRGQLRRGGRRDRPSPQRPRLFARDGCGGRRAARADGLHRPAHGPDRRWRHARRRGRDRRRRYRDRARPADRRPGPARGRRPGRRPHPGRGGPPHGGRTRTAPGLRRRDDADGLRHRRRALLASRGGRPAVRLEQPSGDPGRGALDRLGVLRTDAGAPGRPRPGDRATSHCARSGRRPSTTRRTTCRSSGRHSTGNGAAIAGRDGRVARRSRDDVGTGRRPGRGRSGRPRRDATDRRFGARSRPVRRGGPEPPGDRSDRAAVPDQRGRRRGTARVRSSIGTEERSER